MWGHIPSNVREKNRLTMSEEGDREQLALELANLVAQSKCQQDAGIDARGTSTGTNENDKANDDRDDGNNDSDDGNDANDGGNDNDDDDDMDWSSTYDSGAYQEPLDWPDRPGQGERSENWTEAWDESRKSWGKLHIGRKKDAALTAIAADENDEPEAYLYNATTTITTAQQERVEEEEGEGEYEGNEEVREEEGRWRVDQSGSCEEDSGDRDRDQITTTTTTTTFREGKGVEETSVTIYEMLLDEDGNKGDLIYWTSSVSVAFLVLVLSAKFFVFSAMMTLFVWIYKPSWIEKIQRGVTRLKEGQVPWRRPKGELDESPVQTKEGSQ